MKRIFIEKRMLLENGSSYKNKKEYDWAVKNKQCRACIYFMRYLEGFCRKCLSKYDETLFKASKIRSGL